MSHFGAETIFANDSVKVEAATTFLASSSIIQCTANNSEGSTTIKAYAVINPYSAPEYIQLVHVSMYGISGALIFTFIVWFVALSCRKTSEPQWVEMHDLHNNEIFSVPPEFEYPMKNIIMGKKIAEGTFGEILLAKARNILCNDRLTEVAVKKLKATASEVDLQAMISEAHVMFQMGQHLNLVNFLGVVTQGITNNEFLIVLEYCRHGSLHQYLNKYRNKFVDCWEDLQHPWVRSVRNVFKTIDLVSWAAQVANGMAHLASLSIVHGDLSTRHVLLHDGNVVKISDFTLARKVRHAIDFSRPTSADINMLSLERDAEQTFSVSSDIWAFGVYLWDLFTLGAPPALESTENYYMSEKPAHANEEMYGIIKQCWERSPAMTPTFDELAVHLNSMLPLELQSVCFINGQFYFRTS
ncbi:platelet-derived growth factor receptor beta-like [Anopheles ziemanni]|uniref:platelet-derived growth factor receptor beta-like n=1 Tax=Anopheles coustani TaxID=139045 RepID=UPI00265A93BC|nr:platelet-derived growth factor receptor beta-like [Anopheles coustani]XP_058169041.1 platelet-derived growth factor receptor beta-like [Anopheles ziemanni]